MKKIIGFLKMFNEGSLESGGTGNLRRCLENLSKLCQEIVICNDSSTDDSVEIAKEFTKHIITMPNDFKSELKHKQELLNIALKLKPDYIFSIDPDEILEKKAIEGGIQGLINQKPNIDGFEFLLFNLWKNTKFYRADDLWLTNYQCKLWKNTEKLRFMDLHGLHNPQHPLGLEKRERTDFKIIHFGFSSKELIDRKYKTYKSLGQTGWLLERIRSEEGLILYQVDKSWF